MEHANLEHNRKFQEQLATNVKNWNIAKSLCEANQISRTPTNNSPSNIDRLFLNPTKARYQKPTQKALGYDS